MREEQNKNNGMMNAQNFQTLPSQAGGPMNQQPGPHTGPNTPAHQRQQNMSQTMHVSIMLMTLSAKFLTINLLCPCVILSTHFSVSNRRKVHSWKAVE
jgi:hypothetical protein